MMQRVATSLSMLVLPMLPLLFACCVLCLSTQAPLSISGFTVKSNNLWRLAANRGRTALPAGLSM